MRQRVPGEAVLTGDGNYDYQCANAACDQTLIEGFNHVTHRVEPGVVFQCAKCETRGSMPPDQFPATSGKQVVITNKPPQPPKGRPLH